MTDLMNVLVCGGRDYTNKQRVFNVLTFNRAKIRMLVHGGAKGADSLAGLWAAENDVPCLRVPAEWKKYGKKAGAIRNRQMLALVDVDLVVAFPGRVGTNMMVELAKKAGVRVIDLRPAQSPTPPARKPVARLTEEQIDAGVEHERSVMNHCEEEDPRVRNDRLNVEAALREACASETDRQLDLY